MLWQMIWAWVTFWVNDWGTRGTGKRRRDEEAAEAADMRHSQVRSMDRSERIRTYNFPENRIVDHRTGYKAYNLDQVLDGEIQAVIDSDIQADEAARLEAQAKKAENE